MDIGVGLPNGMLGADRRGIVDWARRAEEAGFSSLGTIDRLAYPAFEPLTTLAAAAAVTERIGLVTDILLGPLRSNNALFAKQAATVDQLSEGRLTLGLGVGLREDDFEAAGVDYHKRGALFERQLEDLMRFWAGEGRVGPEPWNGERPAMLIGGGADVAYERAAKYADGWTLGGGPPEAFTQGLAKMKDAWSAAGRDGDPRAMAMVYFALGDGAKEIAHKNFGDYYGFLGEFAQNVVDSAALDADALRSSLTAFEQAGADEVLFFPASTDPDQVELLAEAVGL